MRSLFEKHWIHVQNVTKIGRNIKYELINAEKVERAHNLIGSNVEIFQKRQNENSLIERVL